jgi:hypothetical protein
MRILSQTVLAVFFASSALAAEWNDSKYGLPPLNHNREEVLTFFATNVYGVRPDMKSFKSECKVIKTQDLKTCILKKVSINTLTPLGEKTFVATAYFPKKEGKVPVWVMPGFEEPIRTFMKAHEGVMSRWPVDLITLSNSYATVTFKNEDVLVDKADALSGIERASDSWGAISAWALAASRVVDWLETVPEADMSKIAIVGLSRLGKTALWAGAQDTRFSLVCPTCSGLFGVRCTTVNVGGETIERITRVFPHWFAPVCRERWSGMESKLPFDQHWLVAAVSPRLLAIGSAKEDMWACPTGEFTSFFLARNAWKDPTKCHYHIREGKHGLTREDWQNYIDFAKKHGW